MSGAETMLTPELVIFDLDGTLIEFHHDFLFDQTDRVLRQLGFDPVPRPLLSRYFSEFDYFQFVEAKERESFVERFWQLFDWDRLPQPMLLPGSLAAVAELTGRGIRTAIATARVTSESELRQTLGHTGLLEHVSCLATRASAEVHWTDKTGSIREVCHRLKISPRKALMVGDNPTDITSAKTAGVGYTVAVSTGGIREEVLAKAGPDAIIPDVRSLVDVLSS